MKQIITTIFALCLTLAVWAQPNGIQEANNFYKEGKFKEAIKEYEFVLQTGIESPEMYYNLANAYYKTGKIAPSILNYERALILAPNDKDIQYNLQLAQGHVLDKLEVIPEFFLSRWFRELRTDLSEETWSMISIFLFIAALILGSLYLYSNREGLKKMGFFFGALALILSITCFSFASQQTEKLIKRNHAIIFSPSVTIKGSPDESGTDLFLLHEGTKVKVIDSLGEWRNIQLSDGNEGWLKKEDIEII